jgi:hypothetical protein
LILYPPGQQLILDKRICVRIELMPVSVLA